jgi:hypothetical protein
MERAIPLKIGMALLCRPRLLPFLAFHLVHFKLGSVFFLRFPLFETFRLDFFKFVIILIWHVHTS